VSSSEPFRLFRSARVSALQSSAALRQLLVWAIPVVTVFALMAAMLFTSRAFSSDWVNNLWLSWEQSLNIKALGHPSYFLTSSLGVFQPEYGFYGGTAYTGAAYLSLLLGGHPIAGYILAFGIALVLAYAGCWWIASQMGLGGWIAHVPAVLFVTSSYYVSNLYGRGDFPEAVATSLIPLVAASGIWLVRAPRWRPLPLFTFIAAVFFLAGSHPETFIWGSTFLIFITVVLLWSAPEVRRRHWRRLAAVVGVAVLAICLDGWSLVPTALYNSRLLISSGQGLAFTQFWYTSPGALFAIARDAPSPPPITGTLQAQLPTLAIVWSMVVMVALRRRATHVMLRIAIGLGLVLAVFAVLAMLRGSLNDVLPWPWKDIQFAYRLVIYGTLAACGLVAVAVLALRDAPARTRRWMSAAVAIVCLISFGAAMKQIWSAPSFYFKNRSQGISTPGVAPVSYYPGVTYTDVSARVVKPTVTSVESGTPLTPAPAIEFPYTRLNDVSVTVKVPPSGTVATNIATGSYMVKLKGAVPVGRTPLAPGGGQFGSTYMVVRLTGKPGTLERVTVSPKSSPELRAGLWLSGIACLCVVLLLLVVARARRWPADGRWARILGEPF